MTSDTSQSLSPPDGTRQTPLLPYWDGSKWTVFLPTASGPLAVNCPKVTGTYMAAAPASPQDICVDFVDFVWHHACWPSMHKPFGGLTCDIYNLSTSLAKIDHFFAIAPGATLDLARCVETELEYILLVIRSMLDLLHEASNILWMSTLGPSGKKRRQLPKLSTLLFLDDKLRSNLDPKLGLPEPVSSAYLGAASFIFQLRRLRDAIAHHGSSGPSIHLASKGFCLSSDERIVASFGPFPIDAYLNEDLLSLRPLLAHLVRRTLETCNAIARGYSSSIALPEPVEPTLRVFLGHPHVVALSALFSPDSPVWWHPGAG